MNNLTAEEMGFLERSDPKILALVIKAVNERKHVSIVVIYDRELEALNSGGAVVHTMNDGNIVVVSRSRKQ